MMKKTLSFFSLAIFLCSSFAVMANSSLETPLSFTADSELSADAKLEFATLDNDFFLPSGAQLFIYDNSHTQLLSYSDKDNKHYRELWTPPIEGDSVTIEINVPTAMKPYLGFNIKSIGHGYRSMSPIDGRKSKTSKSGSCNIDTVCSQGDEWRDEISSVGHYTFSKPAGTFVCTGSMVNNTAGDLKPYFLTANHCVFDASSVQSMVVFWNFETSTCGGTPDGSRSQSQSGATLVAGWGGGDAGIQFGDMTLVELDAAPNDAFNVYWAGWDADPVAPSSAVAIHHPAGDEKRISFDTDALTITNYLSAAETTNGTHLRVGAWNEGTTEGGSSGSGIWNSNRHIVGTLSGGFASCQALNDPDWYGRVSEQWLGGGTAETQLKAWLDPINVGVLSLDGRDVACVSPTVSFTSPATAEVGEAIAFTSSVSGGSGGYTYSWDFDGDGNADSTEASPTYTYSRLYQGNVDLTVRANDDCYGQSTAAIVIDRVGGNANPVAMVENILLLLIEGDVVTLDASASTDADGDTLSFEWIQVSGDSVVLNNANTSVATFTAPDITMSTDMRFQVNVTDGFGGEDSAIIDVVIEAINEAPTAIVASANITRNEGALVTLDASPSSDPNNDPLTFVWVQTSGTAVTLEDAESPIATFTAPEVSSATSYTFEVTVTDVEGLAAKETVNVTVNDVPPPAPPTPTSPPSTGGSGGGGSFAWITLMLLYMTILLKNRNQKLSTSKEIV